MNRKIVQGFIFFLVLIFIIASYGIGLAHGQPVISVNPGIVSSGGKITVTGSEMEENEVFSITLEGMTSSTKLGEATAVKMGDQEDAGFETAFTIPSDITPGSYTLKATTEEGESTTADLTITAPSEQASSGPATMQEPSSAPHLLSRSKPLAEEVGIGIVALTSAVLGLWLIRIRGQ